MLPGPVHVVVATETRGGFSCDRVSLDADWPHTEKWGGGGWIWVGILPGMMSHSNWLTKAGFLVRAACKYTQTQWATS